MVSLPLMFNPLSHALLGIALLSATATVYAAGGSWFVPPINMCASGAPGANYIGVCKEAVDASGAKVVFDSTTNPGGGAEGVYGGVGDQAVTGNSVRVSGGEVLDVYGGDSSAGSESASENTVTVSGGSVARFVYGGSSSSGLAISNTVTVSGGSVGRSVYGGSAYTGDAMDNTVTLSGGSVNGNVFGGVSSLGNTSGNSVMVSGGDVAEVYGGYSSGGSGSASNNTVTVSGGSVKEDVFGGLSFAGNASNNVVTVSGGSIGGNVSGGGGSHGNASDNIVTVSGGSIDGNVSGGLSGSGGITTGNRVILAGTPVFGSHTMILGGNSAVAGNILDIRTKGLKAFNVGNFEQYSFLLPADIKAGDTVLTLTAPDGTVLSSTKVGVAMQSGDHLLKKGDKVALIHNSAGVDSTGVTQVDLTGYSGISLKYTFGLSADADNLYAVTKSAPQMREQGKAPVEGIASTMAFSLQGADLVAGMGMVHAVAAGGAGGSGGISAFGAMSGGNSRHNTGSHVDINGANLMLGAAKQVAMGTGDLTVGAFFEGGWGGYDTYNDFDSGKVHGSGRADYAGGGVLARQDWNSGLYAEGSMRGGRMRSNWSSGDMGVPDASYDTSTPYYGAHVGFGVVWPINQRTSIDVSAKYFWTHQGSQDADIAGDPYHFETMDSQRTRLGARMTYAFNDHFKGYAGAAWEHEYDGVARATVHGLDTPSPSLKGDTGVFEVGVSVKPDATRPLTVALGVQGYVGQREGVAGSLNVGWAF